MGRVIHYARLAMDVCFTQVALPERDFADNSGVMVLLEKRPVTCFRYFANDYSAPRTIALLV